MKKVLVVAMLSAFVPVSAATSGPMQGSYLNFKGVVVARSITVCRFDGGPGKCHEKYLVVTTFPYSQGAGSSPYAIMARDFGDPEPHSKDKFFVNRELTLSAIRDSTCDRVVTYEQTGTSCGPEGSSAIYDWRKLVSRYAYPDEGAATLCFRLVAPIPELSLK
jgi:hypothetical protein